MSPSEETGGRLIFPLIFARAADALGKLVDHVGRWSAWLCLPLIVLLFLQLPLREIVHAGNNTDNDFGQVIFAAFFMLGIPFAMRHDAHVRVDIFYQRLTTRQRAAIDLIGTVLFLLPWLALVGWYSLPIVLNSLFEMEKFAETYTRGYFILKLQLFFFVALVGLQAIANIVHAALALMRTPGDRR
jgi:TRAP-type mannitol/chloroaromatic compound transport system permease small subunit